MTRIMEMMEGDYSARTNLQICLDEVKSADLYIILIAGRHGSYPEFLNQADPPLLNKDRKSYTQLEYECACEVFKEKYYGILKLHLTDDFFKKEDIKMQRDIDDDAERKAKHDAFLKKLNFPDNVITINSFEDLLITVNKQASEFQMKYNQKLEVKIPDLEKFSINRSDQIKKIESIDFDGGAYTFIVDVENENDCPEEFTSRLEHELMEEEDVKKSRLINSNDIGSLTSEPDRLMDRLLKAVSREIYGNRVNGITFSEFSQNITHKKIDRNVLIGFYVDYEVDVLNNNFNYVQIISDFIARIQGVLDEGGFLMNFYFIIYLRSDPKTDTSAHILPYLKNIRNYSLGKLQDVQKKDITDWLEGIRQRMYVQTDTDSLFKIMFYSEERFPTKYRRCLELIDKRTK